jgi:hypothetical protein
MPLAPHPVSSLTMISMKTQGTSSSTLTRLSRSYILLAFRGTSGRRGLHSTTMQRFVLELSDRPKKLGQMGSHRYSNPQDTTRSCVTDSQLQTSLSMLLSSELGVHQTIPKEYALDVTAESVNNTFVFTEQDLPGFKSKSRQKFDLSNANMPARLTRPNSEKTKQPWDPNKRFTPYFKKAIPSEFDSLRGRRVLILAHQNEQLLRVG